MTALFGGAFDPPHNGHVALARAALERFPLESIFVLVTARPGHRAVEAAPDVRLRLAEAAFAGLPRTAVELDDHRYTIDLLRSGRWPEPLFLIGADEFAGFLTWKDPDAILEVARLGVATRPGFPPDRLEEVLRRLARPERVELFEIPPVEASASEIRNRLAVGEPIDDLVPPGVAGLVTELDLYRR